MARTRLIAIAAFQSEPERILGCYSEADLAMDAILSAHVPAPAGGQLFFEEPDNAYPKMIQARFALNGEARHLGRIMVDRGSVDTVLAELRKSQSVG